MTAATHAHYVSLIARLFERGLEPHEAQVVMTHVRDCASCEQAYARWARAERALARKDDSHALTASQSDRVLGRLLGPEAAAPAPEVRGVHVLLAAAAALVVALALGVGGRGPSAAPDERLQPRGVVPSAATTTLRILRVQGSGDQVRIADLGRAGVVHIGDRLRVLGSATAATTFVRLAVHPPAGQPRAQLLATPLAAGTIEAPLGALIEVTPDWGPGPGELRVEFESGGERQVLAVPLEIRQEVAP